MARVCLSTWGVTRFSANDGQPRDATTACLSMRYWNASWLRADPLMVGNAGSEGCPCRSASQLRKTAIVSLRSGVLRSLRPFPWRRGDEHQAQGDPELG